MDNTVSVVIPTKNRKEIISKTIDSVLNQSIKPLEIIIIDDGSSDDTQRFLSENYPMVIVFRNEVSVKGAVARNQGASVAKGEYLAFLDSDDIWLEDHLKDAIKVIQRTNADGAFGSYFIDNGILIKEISFFTPYFGGGTLAAKLFSGKLFDARTSTFVFKKEKFDQIRFDENLEKHQDWDLAINFDNKFTFVTSDFSTVCLKVSHGSERMSDKPNHSASFRFIEKNKRHLTANEQLFFSLKRIMHSQKFSESRKYKLSYLVLLQERISDLSLLNKIIFFLLKKNLLNVYMVYRFTKLLQKT